MLPSPLSKADLHLLHVFTTVVESRGFSAAQVELNVSPSTISRQISDLELRLGMRLCQRGRAGFLLTEHGESVYRAAQRLFASVQEFTDAVQDVRGKLTGTLTIATIDSWVFNQSSPFALALRDMVKQAPDVTLELHTLAPDDIEMAVIDARVSLGIGVFHRHVPSLVYEPIATETVGLYCAAAHPLAQANTPEEIQTCLAQARYAKRAYLRERDVAPISRGLSANAHAHQVEGVAQMILTGEYVGYLPLEFAETWIARGEMHSVGAGRYDQPSEIKLVRKRGTERNRAAKFFETLLKKHVA